MFGTRLTSVAVLTFVVFAAGAHAATATITFDSPRGGEVYALGQVQQVRLGAKTKAKSVAIELSRDGGTTFEALGNIDNSVKDITQRNVLAWTASAPASSNCVIRATGMVGKTNVSAVSSPFSIGSAGAPIPGSITSAAMAPGSVTTVGLANGSVTNPKLAASAVSTDKMTSGAASSGMVLTANGLGGASYAMPVAASDVAATAGNSIAAALNDPSTTTSLNAYVKKSGDTMTGCLNLPANGLVAGTNQFVLSGGNVGIGTATPGAQLEVATAGTAAAGVFQINNANNGATVIRGTTNGLGEVAYFANTNSANSSMVLDVNTNGSGSAVYSRTTGTGQAGAFINANTANSSVALSAYTNGTGSALFASSDTTGTSSAGVFVTYNTSSTAGTVHAATMGTGAVLEADHRGASGDIALFQSQGGNQARIDKTGKGFFNGGTQTGGADVAEAFKADGRPSDYEPGDVLVVSKKADRQAAKSAEPYSTRVAGVYATKPGVLLTERGIDEKLEDTVPLGIAGVIPTKVSGENGRIKRGDLLVSSGTLGHAMKGTDRARLVGAVIGKALENFDEEGTGVIKVLVNVK